MFGNLKLIGEIITAVITVLAPFVRDWLKEGKGPILEKAAPHSVSQALGLFTTFCDEHCQADKAAKK